MSITSAPSDAPAEELDTTGLVCPEPLMLVRNRVREMRSGEVLRVTATDPSTGRDFANFCRFMGHELLEQTEREGVFVYRIKKG
jgi:tRNA 2-thiouridine synthesizing protein A